MSTPNKPSKPDLDEKINISHAHGRIAVESSATAREKRLNDAGREAFPLWVLTLCGVVLLIAGGVLNGAGKLFSYDQTFRKNYVRSEPPGAASKSPTGKAALVAFSAKGAKLYSAKCSGCHGADAKGDGANYPSLVGSAFVTQETEKFAMIIINGIQGPTSTGKTYGNGIMPPQGAGLTPEDFASLMTYVRNNFGNSTGDIVTVDMAKKAFEISAARAKAGQAVTADEIRNEHKAMLPGEIMPPDTMVNPATLAPMN